MNTLNGQWIDVFRAGSYGEKGTYTPAMLAEMCANYDPTHDEVPFTKGHPEHDGPAFGWVKALRLAGDTVQALPGDMNAEFDGQIKAGAFRKRSVAFKQNADGSLKQPLELRHIGFLGAMLPGVKGLRDPKFGDGKYREIDTEFSENTGEIMDQAQIDKTVGERVAAFFAELGIGKKPEAGAITQAQVDAAAKQAADAVKAQFTAELATERTAREKIAAEFASLQTASGASAATVRAHTLIQGLKDSKRWLPAYDRMGVPAMFAALTSSGAADIVFSDGTAEQKKHPAQLFFDILNGLGAIVPEGTVFVAGKLEAPAPERKIEGVAVAPGSAAFSDAVKVRAAEKKIPYGEALKELHAEGKSSATFGGATAGEV